MIAYSKGRFDEAEEYYLRNDRPDLAIQMRCKLGDFLRAEELVKKYGSDDYAKTNLWNLLGDAYADQSCWDKAAHYYAKVSQRSFDLLQIAGAVEEQRSMVGVFVSFEGFQELGKIGKGASRENGDALRDR